MPTSSTGLQSVLPFEGGRKGRDTRQSDSQLMSSILSSSFSFPFLSFNLSFGISLKPSASTLSNLPLNTAPEIPNLQYTEFQYSLSPPFRNVLSPRSLPVRAPLAFDLGGLAGVSSSTSMCRQLRAMLSSRRHQPISSTSRRRLEFSLPKLGAFGQPTTLKAWPTRQQTKDDERTVFKLGLL